MRIVTYNWKKRLTIYYSKSLTIAIVFRVLESCATDLAITTVFRKIAIGNVSRGITLIFTTISSSSTCTKNCKSPLMVTQVVVIIIHEVLD